MSVRKRTESLAVVFALLVGGQAHAQRPDYPESLRIDLRDPGSKSFELELTGNFSRLPALVGVRDSDDLAQKHKNPAYARALGKYLKAKYPYAHRVRVGNLFFGNDCAGLKFRDVATRDASGRITYDFDEVIAMLDLVVGAGFKPLLALTGVPSALVPPGEELVKHPAYGCVNGPVIDWSKPAVPARSQAWWDLQHAFFQKLVQHFGIAELKKWEFATWTEPYNPRRLRESHLYYSASSVPDNRYDEAVATILATSIDAAMSAGLPIRIGNFAGDMSAYPRIIEALRKMDRGPQYLAYIDGYAVSRYRTRVDADIGKMVAEAAALQKNPQMPDKPLFIDELGELVDDTGNKPPRGIQGLESAAFFASALHNSLASQANERFGIRRVAIWEPLVGDRDGAARADPARLMPSAMDNTIAMYARFDGLAIAAVHEGSVPIVAARTGAGLYLVASAPAKAELCEPESRVSAQVTVTGLRPDGRYEIVTRTIDAENGNAISAYLGRRPSYLCGDDRLAKRGGAWTFASADAEHCFFEDAHACDWRRDAAGRAIPKVQREMKIPDSTGSVTLALRVHPGASVAVEVSALSSR